MTIPVRNVTDTRNPNALIAWTNDILSQCAGLTLDPAVFELKNAIDDFCRESMAWVEVVTYETSQFVVGQETLEVNPDDGERRIIYVNAVRWDDRVLRPMSSSFAVSNIVGTPTAYTCPTPDVIRFIPIPTAVPVTAVYAELVFAPVNAEDYLPSFFLNNFYEAVLSGALARLVGMSAKPWTDLAKAQYHMRRFRGQCREAAAKRSRGYTPDAPSWRFPPFK